MGFSIQDYLKKINSWLSFTDIASLCMTLTVLILFLWYLSEAAAKNRVPVVYQVGNAQLTQREGVFGDSETMAFGSKNGKTYTYSWCGGSGNIKPTNKIFFTSPTDAEAKGRTLSKLCKK